MISLITALIITACPPDALCQPGFVCAKFTRAGDKTTTVCMLPEELAQLRAVERARRALARQKAAQKTKEAPVVVAPVPAPVVAPVVVEQPVVVEAPPAVVEKPTVVTVNVQPSVIVLSAPERRASDFTVGPWVGLGGGVQGPWWSAQMGVRGKSRKAHAGFEVFTAFNKGYVGAEFLGYTFDNGTWAHHVDVGAMLNGPSLLSTLDVPRKWDVLVGTGAELKIHKNISLTLDWRWAVPDPIYMAHHNGPVHDASGNQVFGQAGRYLDTKAVIGNSLSQSQLVFGVTFHNW